VKEICVCGLKVIAGRLPHPTKKKTATIMVVYLKEERKARELFVEEVHLLAVVEILVTPSKVVVDGKPMANVGIFSMMKKYQIAKAVVISIGQALVQTIMVVAHHPSIRLHKANIAFILVQR
jgi:formate-dependent nitrite reductase membrane component NrfD